MRGEGSLQALLGRDIVKRKRSRPELQPADVPAAPPGGEPIAGGPRQQRSAPSKLQAACGSLVEPGHRVASAPPPSAAAGKSKAPASPLKPGCVRCPVCGCQLAHDDAAVNAHIDKCLSKGALRKRTQQASIFKFATPAGPSTGRRTRSGASGAAALATSAAAAASTLLGAAADELHVMAGSGGEVIGAGGAAGASPAGHSQPARAGKGQSRPPQQQQRQGSPSVSWPSQNTPSSQEEAAVQPRRRALRPAAAAGGPSGGGTPGTPRRHGAAAAPAPAGLRCFSCSVVGRHFQKHEVRCQTGQRLVVEWEAGNPRDAHALLALDSHSRLAVGHLPHVVARHLAPLLRGQQAVVEAVVLEEPLGGRAPLLVELQVATPAAAPAASPGAAGRAAASLARAEAAAAGQLQRAPQATGERLHANFLAVVDTVQQHDSHLLAEQETGFVAAYKALPPPAQCLFLRLFQRRGPLFRLAALAYREVPDAAAAAEELAGAGLAATVGAAGGAAAASSWTDVAELLTVPELAAVLAARKLKAGLGAGGAAAGPRNRQQLLGALEAHAALSAAAAAQLACWLLQATGPVVRLAPAACEAVCRLQRLFFLNEGQSLSQFLASDLGVMRYPQYLVHRSGSAFASRPDLLAFEAALRHAEQLTDAAELGDMEAAEAALQPAWAALDANLHKQTRGGVHGFLRQFHAGEVYCIMASIGVDLLERQKRYKEAVQRLDMLLGGCFCFGRRGEWWERLAVDLKHLGRHQEALERAEAALADEWLTCGSRLALQRRVLLLGRPPWRWKVPVWAPAAKQEPPEVRITARPLNRTTGTKSRFYGLDDEQCSVEELALQYYASPEGGGWLGTHCEGGIWATLFGLLMWDVLFMPVPDVFRTPFQTAPLDLNTPSFYPTRKEAIEACLGRVAAGEAPAMLRRTWEQQQGALCRGVSWERHSLEELQEVAGCVGGAGLAAVCRLLAQDHAGWSGGMPDLLLWRPASRDAKLSEVKGPRDRLSCQQTAWMHALLAAGLRAEVLKVVEPEQAAARKRRR